MPIFVPVSIWTCQLSLSLSLGEHRLLCACSTSPNEPTDLDSAGFQQQHFSNKTLVPRLSRGAFKQLDRDQVAHGTRTSKGPTSVVIKVRLLFCVQLLDELRGIRKEALRCLRAPHEALAQLVEALGVQHGHLHIALRRQRAPMLPESTSFCNESVEDAEQS